MTIKQIIPAPITDNQRLYARFTFTGHEIRRQVLCLALVEENGETEIAPCLVKGLAGARTGNGIRPLTKDYVSDLTTPGGNPLVYWGLETVDSEIEVSCSSLEEVTEGNCIYHDEEGLPFLRIESGHF